MDTPIITLASLNTIPMGLAATRMNNQLMALTRALFHTIEFLNEDIPAYTFIMTRKELKHHLKMNGYEKYKIAEELFPRKKKRGSMRRARRDKEFTKFFGILPGDVYIDEWDWREES